LLQQDETLCITGSAAELGNWSQQQPILLSRNEGEDFYFAKINFSKAAPLSYKYAVYNTSLQTIVRYESGNNRFLFETVEKNTALIVNDGFANLLSNTWKGAGVAIPVFSLRSEKSFGTGEFTDLKLLTDWAKKTGLQLIQILPINDTTATRSWTDSYPYAAISAFALHPLYINISVAAGEKYKTILKNTEEERLQLNALPDVDYEAVTKCKWKLVEQLYSVQKNEIFSSEDYRDFFESNRHWLMPYAAFCYLRDKYGTADFNQWKTNSTYNAEEIKNFFEPSFNEFDALAIHCFVQYHLHVQLKDAATYAHEKWDNFKKVIFP